MDHENINIEDASEIHQEQEQEITLEHEKELKMLQQIGIALSAGIIWAVIKLIRLLTHAHDTTSHDTTKLEIRSSAHDKMSLSRPVVWDALTHARDIFRHDTARHRRFVSSQRHGTSAV